MITFHLPCLRNVTNSLHQPLVIGLRDLYLVQHPWIACSDSISSCGHSCPLGRRIPSMERLLCAPDIRRRLLPLDDFGYRAYRWRCSLNCCIRYCSRTDTLARGSTRAFQTTYVCGIFLYPRSGSVHLSRHRTCYVISFWKT